LRFNNEDAGASTEAFQRRALERLNLKDNSFLNHTAKNASGWGYAVFGEVIEGMDVVDKMATQATGNRGGHSDVPKTDIVIEKAELLK